MSPTGLAFSGTTQHVRPPAPNLAPEVTRRIDRLARRAHLFHRFAHHPLCDAYAGEVVRLGRRSRLCRGCTLAAAGGVLGVVAGLVVPVPAPGTLAAVLGLAVLASWLALRAPRLPVSAVPARRERRSKLLTRAGPLALALSAAVLGARARTLPGAGVALGALALLALAVAAYRRRGPDRSPCQACPERTRPAVCSGFRPMARREAAFSRAASRLLSPPPAGARAGFRP
jgi:hypothetical protein